MLGAGRQLLRARDQISGGGQDAAGAVSAGENSTAPPSASSKSAPAAVSDSDKGKGKAAAS